jgi:competence protein ComEA
MTLKLIVSGAVVAALSFATVGAQDSLPDGPGKQTVERVCSACHDLDTATGARHTRAEWRALVNAMVDRGAKATDEEFGAIVEYLAINVGLVNVNKSPAGEMEAVLAIPSKQAEEIVRYRAEHGEFKDLDSLKRVPGLDAMVMEERKDRIAFR